MDQRLLKRIIVALYKRLCSGKLLVIVPELPWGNNTLEQLLKCLENLGWQTDVSAIPGVTVPRTASGRILASCDQVDLSAYQRIWIPAIPLNVLSRLKALAPSNRQEAMILEAMMAGIPTGAAERSWLPPERRSHKDLTVKASELNTQVEAFAGTLGSWGLDWVKEEESGCWVLGSEKAVREGTWKESVLHGSAVRMLPPEIRILRVQRGTVVTAAARDELARREIRLVGDR